MRVRVWQADTRKTNKTKQWTTCKNMLPSSDPVSDWQWLAWSRQQLIPAACSLEVTSSTRSEHQARLHSVVVACKLCRTDSDLSLNLLDFFCFHCKLRYYRNTNARETWMSHGQTVKKKLPTINWTIRNRHLCNADDVKIGMSQRVVNSKSIVNPSY